MLATFLDIVTYKIDKTHITLYKHEKHIKYKKNAKPLGCFPTSILFKVGKLDFNFQPYQLKVGGLNPS